MDAASPKNILITFGRSFLSLELARQLKRAGHRVFVADSIPYHVTRYSNAIVKNFVVPSPRFGRQQYLEALLEIVIQEQIELILPVYEEISCLSSAHSLFPPTCKLFCPPFDLYDKLHNKWHFQGMLKEMGFLDVPSWLLQSPEELSKLSCNHPLAIKPCYSRASQKIKKILPNESELDLMQQQIASDVDIHNPWVAQQWLEGNKFCTYTICHEGTIYAHGTYPVHYAIDGNSCLTFEAIVHDAIYSWVSRFVKTLQFTGQIAFDFIETKEGKLYAIECNPRATSGLLLFCKKRNLAKALLKENQSVLHPLMGTCRQIAFGMMMYGWRASAIANNSWSRFFTKFIATKDVVFAADDPKPFFFNPWIFAHIWSNSRRLKLSVPAYFTYDHDWNGEPLRG